MAVVGKGCIGANVGTRNHQCFTTKLGLKHVMYSVIFILLTKKVHRFIAKFLPRHSQLDMHTVRYPCHVCLQRQAYLGRLRNLPSDGGWG